MCSETSFRVGSLDLKVFIVVLDSSSQFFLHVFSPPKTMCSWQLRCFRHPKGTLMLALQGQAINTWKFIRPHQDRFGDGFLRMCLRPCPYRGFWWFEWVSVARKRIWSWRICMTTKATAQKEMIPSLLVSFSGFMANMWRDEEKAETAMKMTR